MTKDNECQDEIDAVFLFNSDKSILDFLCVSGGSIGPSKLTKQKKCLCCGEPRDNDGICRDCILSARDGWLEHYWNHVKEGIPNTNCKLCTELKP